MSKASWKLTFFGIALGSFVSCSDDDNVVDENVPPNQLSIVLKCDGPIWADCERTTPNSSPARVHLFYDWEGNGPDPEGDYTPCGPGQVCIPEDVFASFIDFFIDESHFVSPVLRISNGTSEPLRRFYLRLYPSETGQVQWTSPLFYYSPHWGLSNVINLPFVDWTCDSSGFEQPTCYSDPLDVWFYDSDTASTEKCVRLCRDSHTGLFLYNASEPMDPLRVPIIEVLGGCDDGELPSSVNISPACWEYMDWIHLWLLDGRFVVGDAYGFVKVRLLDTVPCCQVENFVATQHDSTVVLTWNTTTESDLAQLEVWIDRLPVVSNWPARLAVLSPSGGSSGANYEYADSSLLYQGTYYYTLVAISNGGQKYPASRAVLHFDP